MEFQALFQLNQPLRYLCQDETRIGRKTQTARVITAHGVKPIAKVEWPREAFWLYGIVEPETGWHFTQEYEKLNSTNFQAFIDAISEQLGDTIAVIQIDGAPAHRAKALEWPENLIPVFQPPHSPELNPIERLWEFLKSLWKGENFASLQELRERVTKELEMLTPEQIQSLTSYNFILDTLLATKFDPAEFHLVQAYI